MSPLFLVLPWAALCLPLAGAVPLDKADHAAAPAAFFTDPDHLLSADPSLAREYNARLADFARRTGITIHLQLHAAFTPTTPAQRPGTFTGLLAEQMHLDDQAILALYFADTGHWGLWIGAAQLTRLMGRPGDAQTFTRDGSLHRAKQDLVTSALARVAPGPASTASGETRLQVEAMITVLLERFAPAAPRP